MPDDTPDAVLLASRVPDDFGRFYRRHVGAVTSYVGRRTERADVAFDVVAETFARALARRDHFDPARGPAIAWLLTIARNLMIDAARRGRVADETRRRLRHEPVALDDDDLAAIDRRRDVDLAAALGALPEDQRTLVLQRVLEERSYPSLAADVGCSEQVVRKRVSRALASLRHLVKEQQS
ncbi:RNA polymerase sigma factor [Patulibacter minatonensis]|uniref:RNA polymerase sigma factor n=1 Tax=Patulibacter minatonensis TaxID=298163 RepID=UPI00047AF59C|nr:sigma-70 family RNA polymerase sigma factor [Patulibacter minatonensis]